jgi:hypothetical protein
MQILMQASTALLLLLLLAVLGLEDVRHALIGDEEVRPGRLSFIDRR